MAFKDFLIEAIASMYSTTVSEVSGDISAMPEAMEHFEQFCEAMEQAGY